MSSGNGRETNKWTRLKKKKKLLSAINKKEASEWFVLLLINLGIFRPIEPVESRFALSSLALSNIYWLHTQCNLTLLARIDAGKCHGRSGQCRTHVHLFFFFLSFCKNAPVFVFLLPINIPDISGTSVVPMKWIVKSHTHTHKHTHEALSLVDIQEKKKKKVTDTFITHFAAN